MIIHVKVIPNAKTEGIAVTKEGEYKIKVSAQAFEGRANARLTEMLAKHFKVPKSAISIKNPLSRKKIIEIKGL